MGWEYTYIFFKIQYTFSGSFPQNTDIDLQYKLSALCLWVKHIKAQSSYHTREIDRVIIQLYVTLDETFC